MPGIDLLISRPYSQVLKNSLDGKILSKLERELFFEEGMSIKLAIEHYDIFQKILQKNYKNDLQKFQNDSIQQILKICYLEGSYSVNILEEGLCNLILDYYGDPESRKILSSIMGKKLTISEILEISEVLKSPAYRKIENLLLDGLILETGKILTKNKRVSQYSCIFDDIQFLFKNQKLIVKCHIAKKFIEESSIFNSGLLNQQLV